MAVNRKYEIKQMELSQVLRLNSLSGIKGGSAKKFKLDNNKRRGIFSRFAVWTYLFKSLS